MIAPFGLLALLAVLSMGTIKIVEVAVPTPSQGARLPDRGFAESERVSGPHELESVLDRRYVPRVEVPGERLSFGEEDDALAPFLPPQVAGGDDLDAALLDAAY
ncbi:MAG: hypothetical protein R3E88_11590 [Myxococcota bacterium]